MELTILILLVAVIVPPSHGWFEPCRGRSGYFPTPMLAERAGRKYADSAKIAETPSDSENRCSLSTSASDFRILAAIRILEWCWRTR
jgi:hypothetical protein